MEERKRETITVCLIPVGGQANAVEIPADNTLAGLQSLVHGYVDVLNIRNDGIVYWVNDEGLYTEAPNRAIYASKFMEDEGFVSQLNFNHPVKEGELYALLFGNIVATREDAEGNIVDMTAQDIEKMQREHPVSHDAYREIARMQRERRSAHDQENVPALDSEAQDMSRAKAGTEDARRGGTHSREER